MKNKEKQNVRALILAGGKGTRSENPLTPKILQTISEDQLLIDIHLANLANQLDLRITFLLGYLHSPIVERIRELEKESRSEIDWVLDKAEETPVSAVFASIQNEINPDTIFIILLGDILANVNFTRYVAKLKESDFLGMVLVHPNLHPSESDAFEYGDADNAIKICLKGNGVSSQYPARAIAGVYFLKKSALEYFNLEESDFAKGVIAPLFNAGKLRVENTFEYFQDTGTKGRLEKARKDYSSGAYDLRGRMKKGCIFIDRDGTLIPDIGANRKNIEKSDISAGTIESIVTANECGIPVILVTNQPGIAKGFLTVRDFLATQYQLESILNENSALLDDFIFCPHHPESGFKGEVLALKIKCECRKPGTGMIKEMARRHSIDIKKSIFIGDSDVDFQTASTCGMLFLKVAQDQSEIPDVSPQMYEAITRIKS
jgi:mannose-1-phosphate guanylyltransferase/phosphomannomutase